jgi:transcriptional regulator with XRE-family HTH domain
MNSKEFLALRQRLQKTQKEMSQLMGISVRAVQSFEQGWRKVPTHVERQMLFLSALKKGLENMRPCWEMRGCSLEVRQACPALEFSVGQLCWFISGTLCEGKAQRSWAQKIRICRKCRVFAANVGL